MKNFSKLTLSLFLTLSATSANAEPSTVAKPNIAATKTSRVPAQAGRLTEDQMNELWLSWNQKINALSSADPQIQKEASDIFNVAAQIFSANPDHMLNLAEDLEVLMKRPAIRDLIAELWKKLPNASKLKLISKENNENLWEMAVRLNTKGNG